MPRPQGSHVASALVFAQTKSFDNIFQGGANGRGTVSATCPGRRPMCSYCKPHQAVTVTPDAAPYGEPRGIGPSVRKSSLWFQWCVLGEAMCSPSEPHQALLETPDATPSREPRGISPSFRLNHNSQLNSWRKCKWPKQKPRRTTQRKQHHRMLKIIVSIASSLLL